MFYKLGYFITFLHWVSSPANTKEFPPSIPEDGRQNFTELAKKYDLNSVGYDVVTQDGYVLQLFRIPGNVSQPVLLLHGLFGTSDDFLVRGRGSLCVHLAATGRDVWAANVRGNRYSRRHVRLHPDADHAAFFDYSLDDYALLDLPAIIDKVLHVTGQTRLSAVAYSEGTTTFFALGAAKPEYNDKIKVLVALAPFVLYAGTALQMLGAYGPLFYLVAGLLKVSDVFDYGSPTRYSLENLCGKGRLSYALCWGPVAAFGGADDKELEPAFRPVLLGHFPAGTSVKNLYHMTQISNSGKFRRYDYGSVRNRLYYGSEEPPAYDLSKVSMRVGLVVARNDMVTPPQNADALRERLPSVVRYTVLRPTTWTHLDFTYARHADEYLFPEVDDILNTYG